jgi:hypothetical protein
MNKLIFFAGIVFFIGSILLVISNYGKLNIERNGQIVKMRIEALPLSCKGTKSRYFVKYSYEGKIYDKKMRGNYCSRHAVGELVDMKMLENESTILFPNESMVLNLVSFGLLGIFGLFVSISQWKKQKNDK